MKIDPLLVIGNKYGRLEVLAYSGHEAHRHKYQCRCECGSIIVVERSSLLSGHTKSCGCLHNSVRWKNRVTHGGTIRNADGKLHNPEYLAWVSMRARCRTETHSAYHNYGGRGITVCDAWANNFESFLQDVGRRPSKQHSLDRIDNDRGYEPGNVRWSTRTDQGNNRRTNVVLDYNGKAMTMSQWAEELGMSKNTLHCRLKSGMPLEEALTRPVRVLNSHSGKGRLFTKEACEEIRRLVAEGMSRSAVARRFHVTTTTISRVADRLKAYRDTNIVEDMIDA